jgi:hypothetical protein
MLSSGKNINIFMKTFKALTEEIFKKGGREVEYAPGEKKAADALHKSGIRLSKRRKGISSFNLKRIRKLSKKGHSVHGVKKKRK